MLWWFAQTTLIAGALAVVATLAGRWKRLGPEARHVLWLLVLIKLAIPPFVAWPWSVPEAWPAWVEPAPIMVSAPAPTVEPDAIPTPEALPTPLPVASTPPSPEEVLAGVEAAEDLATAEPRSVALPPEVRDPAPRVQEPKLSNLRSQIWDLQSKIGNWQTILLTLWLAGSVVVVARRGFKVFRFHRGLADSRPAPDWLVDETRAIGDRVGVRPPPVVATPLVASPLLWCLGRPRLVLPEVLIKRLGADRWPGILAHELAHLARGDHWVVRLELLVEAAWWWNPLFWLTRRKLHEQAEIACDARVVRALPERRYAYAEALVDVCEHIARSAIPAPSLGVGGAGAAHSLEGRLHMILRDPIPNRSTRRATLLAGLLAALALPAWTLGQQPEAPAARPEVPAAIAPKPEPAPSKPAPPPSLPPAPDVSTPVKLAPNQEPESLPAILAAQAKAREGLGNLSFRYIVTSRVQSHSPRVSSRAGVTGVNPAGGGPGGVGGGPGGGGRPAQAPFSRFKKVHVQVADVILGNGWNYRLDVLEALPASVAAQAPGRPLAWKRRFGARDGEGYTTLEMAWDKTGPVPFRVLKVGASGWQTVWGDSLTTALLGGPNGRLGLARGIDPRIGIDPFDPRPANVLDLTGGPIPFLDPKTAHAEVAGVETIDGREVVRVVWIGKDNNNPSSSGDIGLRGLCWLAPELGYAVVRSDATQDPIGQGAGQGRRSWRKRASDFVKVANLWLPRKVSYEETQADPSAEGDPLRRCEEEMTLEDYRVDPTLPADTFRPKLAIQTLDDLSGNFTAQPPEVPTGLVERLKKAVAESKFGPPLVERTTEEPKADATLPGVRGKPGEQPTPGPRVSLSPGTLLQASPASAARMASPLAHVDDPAKVDPINIAKPAPGLEDPIPSVDPKVDDPLTANRLGIDQEIQRRFRLDPEVVELTKQIGLADQNLIEARKLPREAGDPKINTAKRKYSALLERYQQLWVAKSEKLREELSLDPARTRDEIEVLQARRDGKAAEMRKAEAQRELARTIVTRNARLKEKGTNLVSNEEAARADAELAITEAEIASKKADLDEADALLNQAKRRLGLASAANQGASTAGDHLSTPAELRDAVELLEVQLQGKQAELRKVQAMADLAQRELTNTKRLADKGGMSQKEVDLYNDKEKAAQAEFEAKKAEVLEAEVRIKQAKRRLETGEARLKRDVERAKARVEWSEGQFKKGFMSKATYEADKATYDELMIQLDANYVPAPAAEAPKTAAP